MIERRLVEAEPSDPMRCQGPGSGGEGQCRYLSVQGLKRDGHLEDVDERDIEGAVNCPKHGGRHTVAANGKQRLYDYRLEVWQNRLDEFTESENVKSLRGEIGVLRLVIQSVLEQCRTPADLVMYSTKISDLVMKVERVVRSCDRLESNMGMLLDQAAALIFASQVVDIIQKHVPDDEAVDQISNGIINALTAVTNKTQEEQLLELEDQS